MIGIAAGWSVFLLLFLVAWQYGLRSNRAYYAVNGYDEEN